MAHPIKHFITITKHRHRVMLHCFKAGIPFQGLTHDLSKYSPTEFIPGANITLAIVRLTKRKELKKDILRRGCIIKAETAIIMNTGWITAQKQSALSRLKCRQNI